LCSDFGAMSCCQTLKQQADFALDEWTWKQIFKKPKGCFSFIRPEAYFALRLFLFLLWFGAVSWSIGDWLGFAPISYWFTKLTHIGALWELLYFGFAAFSTAMAIWGSVPNGKKDRTPWFVSVTWFLGSNMLVITAIVFVLYWLLVYDGSTISAITVVMHGGNFFLAFVDFTWSRKPFNLAHIWVPLTFSLAYGAFTWIYYMAGGTNEDGEPYIYAAIDWRNASGTGSLLGLIVLVVVPVLYVAVYLMYRVCCKPFTTSGRSKSAMDMDSATPPEVLGVAGP